MDYTPIVKRVKDMDDVQRAYAAAKEDNCPLQTPPTHIIEQNGEVVGYWSFGNVPLVMCWHDSEMKTRESIHAFSVGDTVASERGYSKYIVPLAATSPYCDYMGKLGFKEIGTAKLYIKEI